MSAGLHNRPSATVPSRYRLLESPIGGINESIRKQLLEEGKNAGPLSGKLLGNFLDGIYDSYRRERLHTSDLRQSGAAFNQRTLQAHLAETVIVYMENIRNLLMGNTHLQGVILTKIMELEYVESLTVIYKTLRVEAPDLERGAEGTNAPIIFISEHQRRTTLARYHIGGEINLELLGADSLGAKYWDLMKFAAVERVHFLALQFAITTLLRAPQLAILKARSETSIGSTASMVASAYRFAKDATFVANKSSTELRNLHTLAGAAHRTINKGTLEYCIIDKMARESELTSKLSVRQERDRDGTMSDARHQFHDADVQPKLIEMPYGLSTYTGHVEAAEATRECAYGMFAHAPRVQAYDDKSSHVGSIRITNFATDNEYEISRRTMLQHCGFFAFPGRSGGHQLEVGPRNVLLINCPEGPATSWIPQLFVSDRFSVLALQCLRRPVMPIPPNFPSDFLAPRTLYALPNSDILIEALYKQLCGTFNRANPMDSCLQLLKAIKVPLTDPNLWTMCAAVGIFVDVSQAAAFNAWFTAIAPGSVLPNNNLLAGYVAATPVELQLLEEANMLQILAGRIAIDVSHRILVVLLGMLPFNLDMLDGLGLLNLVPYEFIVGRHSLRIESAACIYTESKVGKVFVNTPLDVEEYHPMESKAQFKLSVYYGANLATDSQVIVVPDVVAKHISGGDNCSFADPATFDYAVQMRDENSPGLMVLLVDPDVTVNDCFSLTGRKMIQVNPHFADRWQVNHRSNSLGRMEIMYEQLRDNEPFFFNKIKLEPPNGIAAYTEDTLDKMVPILWHQMRSSTYNPKTGRWDIVKMNTGHLGPLDQPGCTRFLQGTVYVQPHHM